MSAQKPPPTRLRFARRLRALRVARGFKTARSLAAALEIDENRYTRYERAEVEPDIGLIQRICEMLKVTPNELFGIGPELAADTAEIARDAAFAEDGPSYSTPVDADGRDSRARATWRLAWAVAHLQGTATGPPRDDSSVARLQRAARLFVDLERRPYAAVSELLLLPAIADASAEQAQRIGKLVEELTEMTI